MPPTGSIYSNNIYSINVPRFINDVGNQNEIENVRIATPSSLEPPSYNSVIGAANNALKSESQPYFSKFSQKIQNSATI